MNKTHSVPAPSIQSVIAGLHEDGDIVTVTGVLNNLQLKYTKQENTWATAELIDGHTAVKVMVFPLPYQQYRDAIGPVRGADKSLVPPTITATGRVDYRGLRPSLVVSDLQCEGHEEHGSHSNRPMPPAVRADMDLAVITGIVQGAIQSIRAGGKPVPETVSASLAEIADTLHRHGYCDDPTFPLSESFEDADVDDVVARLCGGAR